MGLPNQAIQILPDDFPLFTTLPILVAACEFSQPWFYIDISITDVSFEHNQAKIQA